MDSLCKEPQGLGNGHSPGAARAQRVFGQHSQERGVIVEVSVRGQDLDSMIPSNSGRFMVP